MLWTLPRRLRRATRGRPRRFVGILSIVILVLDFLFVCLSNPQALRVAPSAKYKEKVFIASIHRNNEKILRSHWNAAILGLVSYYGADNVFISVYESGSIENTKEALRELDGELDRLSVDRSIILDEHDQLEEVSRKLEEGEEGWIWTIRHKWELRRIPYLANLRNKVLEPLKAQASVGRKYDVVLWLNDVVFTTEDVTTLLATRGGSYDAVCSLDFSNAIIYYDTFALRDSKGQKALPQTWPYFQSSASRSALMANQPVPVKSCWNGIVAFKSAPFYADPALRFRGIPDSLAEHHLEASECCLIHADNKQSKSRGVWLNPNVRVGYNAEAYDAVNPRSGKWPSGMTRVTGLWRNRLSRWLGWPKLVAERATVMGRVKTWLDDAKREVDDPVEHCLINEMQVLREAGWEHV
ncbi:MAG: hypothetical protein M1818_000785 [Claussenomyces sp. TS43310]|nr:MAG: hypothetical protein M1818_000785 [Claussenomyces sp. TS43310]